MNILNEAIKGAARQFGREFGRAGANSILNGKNYYQVNSNDKYTGRINPSDSKIIKSIKEINKIKFVTTNKANVSRLIEATDIVIEAIKFEGRITLKELKEINDLLDEYTNKFEHGSALIEDDYEDKSVDFLMLKREGFVKQLNEFNTNIKVFVKHNLSSAIKTKKNRNIALILSFPFLGGLGIHKFYFGKYGLGLLYFLFCWTLIPSIAALVSFISILFTSEEKFNIKYNPEYSFYSQFKFED